MSFFIERAHSEPSARRFNLLPSVRVMQPFTRTTLAATFRSRLAVVASVLLTGCLATTGTAGASPAYTPRFAEPTTLTADGTHVWVLNGVGRTVTELDAATGATVRVIGGQQYHLVQPTAIVAGGGHVFVTDAATPRYRYGSKGAVTEIDASTGKLVRVLQGAPYNFLTPSVALSNGVRVWIANHIEGTVDVLGARSGKLISIIGGPKQVSLDEPSGLAIDASHIWITGIVEDARGEPAVLNELTKYGSKPLRRIPGSNRTFTSAQQVVSDGTHVWFSGGPQRNKWNLTEVSATTGNVIGHSTTPLANASVDGLVLNQHHVWVLYVSGASSQLQELNSPTGAIMRTKSGAVYGFDEPDGLASDGRHLWVSNYQANDVIEIDAQTGNLVRTVRN
ncbi:MAG TPA: hypothetical protein VG815_22335 [Chloroflexota bacterium]|jgi:hypothetical protein|nr:hypothetical protein [Chloroflexota bacterium]